jgi:hypothetical protein
LTPIVQRFLLPSKSAEGDHHKQESNVKNTLDNVDESKFKFDGNPKNNQDRPSTIAQNNF